MCVPCVVLVAMERQSVEAHVEVATLCVGDYGAAVVEGGDRRRRGRAPPRSKSKQLTSHLVT